MKLICLFSFVFIGFAFANHTYAQFTKLSLNLSDVSVSDVLEEIEKEADFHFFYNNTLIDMNRKVSVKVDKKDVFTVLDIIFKDSEVRYKVVDQDIILTVGKQWAQGTTVTGTIKDEHGDPMPGVNVVVKGTITGVVSDMNGKYSIMVPNREAMLVYSFVGYITHEFPVGDQKIIDIELVEDTQEIEEVVVVGYGTKRKSDITTAVSVVDMNNIGDIPGLDASRMIQGQAPGVVVKQNTGTPGQEMKITVRGLGSLGAKSDPLYVIDGFPVGTSMQQSVNPNDIESISILKDAASTSIYGARGANGVILITTKGAKEGELKLTASASYGVQNIPDNRRTKVLTGPEFAQFKKESYEDRVRWEKKREPTLDDVPEIYRYPEQTKYSTNWFDEIVNNNAAVQNYNITLSEGKGKVKSVLSLGYVKQDGALINTDFERFNARANIDGEVNKNIRVGWNLSGSRSNENMIDSDGRGAIVGMSLIADPTEPVYNDDGTWNAYLGGHDGIFGYPNPVMLLKEIQKKQHVNRILSNGYVEISFLKDFKFKPSANISILDLKRTDFRPSSLASQNSPPPRNATMTEWNRSIVNYNVDALLTYAKTIGNHAFDAMLGTTAQEENLDELKSDGNTFPDDEIRTFEKAKNITSDSDLYDWSLLAYFARINYAYQGKYLLSASFRREGSSRFGADNKWGNFPSVSLGWRVSEESFMTEISWLSNLKLRGSYGVTGNNDIGNYPSLAGLESGNYILGGALAPGVKLNSFANSMLGWERSNTLDFGLDLSLFNNQLVFTAEFYNRLTDNMLLQKEIPIITGFPNTFTNVGKVRNRGIELAIDYKKQITSDLSLRGNFNITFNRNKVLEIMGENTYIEAYDLYNYYNRSVVGHPIGMYYGFKKLGIFNTEEEIANAPVQDGAIPGVYQYWDADDDGTVSYDTKDMVELGTPHPDFVWAFTLGAEYKGFDLNILFTGAQGYDLIRNIEASIGNLDGVFNVSADAKDRWRSAQNPGKGVYPTTNTWKWEREISSRYVYDASHAWVKSISLGYTIPYKSAILGGTRFYVNAENVFLITNYPGSNPDIDRNGNDANGNIKPGRDDEAYPVPRIFTIGTVINF